MAAYAALVSLARTLQNFIQQDLRQFHKLGALALESPGCSSSDVASTFEQQTLESCTQQNLQQVHDGYKKQLESQYRKVILLSEVFDRSPGRVGKWEAEIRDSANVAESAIEMLLYELGLEGSSVEDKDNLCLDAEKKGSCFGLMLDTVMKELDLSPADDNPQPQSGNKIYEKHKTLEFDHHLIEIRKRLVSSVSQLQIVPIVGMGGIGKTTLARAAFDDPEVVDFFDVRRWVTVSQNYSARGILLAILGGDSDEMASTEKLGVIVNKLLHRRKYLIVFDDIWDLSAWYEVQRLLREDNNKSRVLLTTRHEDVAGCARSSSSIYHLQLMNEESSWRLLEYRVFGEENCPPELIETGKKIANKCGGLPLAIVVVAGVLTNVNLSKDSWENIANDVSEAIRTSEDHFKDILALSYHNLPHYLRPCFLYMSAFHNDEDISVSNLLRLWAAEGFLKPNNKDIEETAYGYLEELQNRNLIMATRKKYNGRTRFCRLHDLLRDLCINIAQEENFLLLDHSVDKEIITADRASFHREESVQSLNKQKNLDLRSILCFCNSNDLFPCLQNCSKILRVLKASSMESGDFPSQLTTFCLLRYLALTQTIEGVFEVPSDIYNLENLETLVVQVRATEQKMTAVNIPNGIWRLPKLRHFRFLPECELPNPSREISPLVYLETLLKIRNFRCSEEVVKVIPNVRKLAVSYHIDPTIETWSDFHFNNLCHLSHLEDLRLIFDRDGYDLDWCLQNPLMKILTLPSSLKVMKFEGGAAQASWEDMARIFGSLPNLQVLKLRNFALSGDVWETREEDFQNLRFLEISHSYLKCWRSEGDDILPRLRHLVLENCRHLTELPDCIGEISTLESITVDDYQEAIVEWAKQIEEEQRDNGVQVMVLTPRGRFYKKIAAAAKMAPAINEVIMETKSAEIANLLVAVNLNKSFLQSQRRPLRKIERKSNEWRRF